MKKSASDQIINKNYENHTRNDITKKHNEREARQHSGRILEAPRENDVNAQSK